MKTSRSLVVLAFLVGGMCTTGGALAELPPPVSPEGPDARAFASRTINVDCSAGDRIMRALRRRGGELVINITGVCVEDVVVTRDRVTFRGTDPTVDGIRAASSDEEFGASLFIRGSRFIHVENLQHTGARRAGLRIENARRHITVDNCRLNGNEDFGLVVVGGGVEVANTLLAGNGQGGAVASETSQLLCDNCIVEDNPAPGEGYGVISSMASSISLRESSITANYAVWADSGSWVVVRDSKLAGQLDTASGFGMAVSAFDSGTVSLRDSTVDGSIEAHDQGAVLVRGTNQVSNPIANLVTDGGRLEAGGPVASNLIGTTDLSRFGQDLFSTTTNLHILTCSSGADAVCIGAVTKTSSTCGLCP